jgi:hypothetical protein
MKKITALLFAVLLPVFGFSMRRNLTPKRRPNKAHNYKAYKVALSKAIERDAVGRKDEEEYNARYEGQPAPEGPAKINFISVQRIKHGGRWETARVVTITIHYSLINKFADLLTNIIYKSDRSLTYRCLKKSRLNTIMYMFAEKMELPRLRKFIDRANREFRE